MYSRVLVVVPEDDLGKFAEGRPKADLAAYCELLPPLVGTNACAVALNNSKATVVLENIAKGRVSTKQQGRNSWLTAVLI